jgi:hypothetical protein
MKNNWHLNRIWSMLKSSCDWSWLGNIKLSRESLLWEGDPDLPRNLVVA